MYARLVVRFAVGCVAAASVGCGAIRPFQPVPPPPSAGADKSQPPRFDYRSGTPAPPPQAARQDTWPQPDHTRTNYAEPPVGGQPPPAGQLPQPQPYPAGQPAPRPSGYSAGYPTGGPQGDPNYRTLPTATGDRMALAPNEMPMDRMVEFIRKVDQLSAENQSLQTKLRSLLDSAEARETALTETLRDVETATAEVTRTRAELNNLRRDLTALKNRVAQMEKDETETLKTVIIALEKLLQQGPDVRK